MQVYQRHPGGDSVRIASEDIDDEDRVLLDMARGGLSRTKLICAGLGLFAVGLIIGVLSGYFGRRFPDADPADCPVPESDGVFLKNVSPKIIEEETDGISKKIIDEVNAEKIRDYLRDLTSKPHLAGTPADLEQAQEMKRIWLDQGLDRVDIVGYDVLLSYPTKGDPNLIKLTAANGTEVFTSQAEEAVLRPEDIPEGVDIVPPFNAYSPAGDIETEKLYYVNYGLESDFLWLINRSINLTGSVVIARYGLAFRANKVNSAEKYGCKAVIFFSDPFDYADPGDNSVYPESWWLPGTGVQRGTVKLVSGDPTTYMYPSLDSAYRIAPEDSEYLPKIPAHPIGYDDAKQILMKLGGEVAPDAWQGRIANLTYKIGGSFIDAGMKVKVHITTHNTMRKTYNVVGYIDGAIEPDRYVVVGNHRDAWVFGSLDPSSGTAAMLESSRAITSVMKSSNWRPRRTIVFCSWGAEEHGIVGSFEFTEHFNKVLAQRTVAYLNVDILLEGMDYMRFRASPLLHSMVYKAAKKIPNPKSEEVAQGLKTVYDQWLHYNPDSEDPTIPQMRLVGSGSDYEYFLQVLGIPSLEPRFTYDSKKYKLSSYPMYHSIYETFYLVNNVMDPGFKLSRAVTQVWTELARELADSLVLPLDVVRFAMFVKQNSEGIIKNYNDLVVDGGLQNQTRYMTAAVEELVTVAGQFVAYQLEEVNKQNPYAVRDLNDKMMNLHRAFLDPNGLPGREYLKNTLSAPSKFDAYSGSIFPSLKDSLYEVQHTSPQDRDWEPVKKAFSILTYYVVSATSTLQKSTQFTKMEN